VPGVVTITGGGAAGREYFVFVTGRGIIGKIVVSFVVPLIGRRALGVLWGFCGAAALAAAAFITALRDHRRAGKPSVAKGPGAKRGTLSHDAVPLVASGEQGAKPRPTASPRPITMRSLLRS
jgi:hypothetical protein